MKQGNGQTKLGYFHQVARKFQTKFWVNNPTLKDMRHALEAGAVCVTTNPTYLARLLREEPGYILSLIDGALKESRDDDYVADIVLQRVIARAQKVFEPLFEQSNGTQGFVAIQGNPLLNDDPEAIVEGAMRYRRLGDNIIVKVPATPAGAKALEKLTILGIPTIATLGFSVAQAVYMAETYRRALSKSKSSPPCYVTFIAGILDTYLQEYSVRNGNLLPEEYTRHAGCAATRVAYRIFRERGYETVLLGGGARGPHHFSELVGGNMSITIGWNLAQQLIESGCPIVPRIEAETPEHILRTLDEKLPDFRKSIYEKSLLPEEFREFGPVAAFQKTFLVGYSELGKTIKGRRAHPQGQQGEK